MGTIRPPVSLGKDSLDAAPVHCLGLGGTSLTVRWQHGS